MIANDAVLILPTGCISFFCGNSRRTPTYNLQIDIYVQLERLRIASLWKNWKYKVLPSIKNYSRCNKSHEIRDLWVCVTSLHCIMYRGAKVSEIFNRISNAPYPNHIMEYHLWTHQVSFAASAVCAAAILFTRNPMAMNAGYRIKPWNTVTFTG